MTSQSQPGTLEKKSAAKTNKSQRENLTMLKMEAAELLGLMEKVRQVGWGGLTAKETGSIGGLMNRIQRERSQNTK